MYLRVEEAFQTPSDEEFRDAENFIGSLEGDWRSWLEAMFPVSVGRGFADHHAEFWEWLWCIEPDSDPNPFVGIWSRGGAKTSSAELGAIALGAIALGLRRKRRYGVYVKDTQDRADDSIQNITALLESATVRRFYPDHSDRMVGKFGDSKGWRRNRLRTRGGFTVDALGLDVAARGLKLEDNRPDFIIFDDIDGRHDSKKVTEKKIATITDSLLPAGTDNVAIVGIQNLIIPNGIFSRMTDGRATFLSGRTISGPHPAIRNLKIEKETREDGSVRHVIAAGTASWAGQNIEACQRLLDRMGLSAFLRECQHEVKEREGALWKHDTLDSTRVEAAPPLKRVVIGVDPSGGGDEIGIVGAGRGYDDHAYVLADDSQPGHLGPNNWARAAVEMYHDLGADAIVAERNFGGDMVKSTIKTVDPTVRVILVHASRGKAVRAEPVASLYTEERAHHVGGFAELEAEETSWAPGDDYSPNRMDAEVWALTDLMLNTREPSMEFI